MDYLNASGTTTRVLGLPGEDFAAYSWGVTEDPVAAGLLNRPYLTRQVVPTGSPAAANLLQALDEPLQEGTLDVQTALAPVARLMSVGQILLQSDLQYERYHLPLPQALWNQTGAGTARRERPDPVRRPQPGPAHPLSARQRDAPGPARRAAPAAGPRRLRRGRTPGR